MRWKEDVPNYWDFYSKATPDENAGGIQKINKKQIKKKPPISHSFDHFIWIGGAISQLWKRWKGENKHLLFVYGTLREGYHWNSKFLSQSRKVCCAISNERYPLVVGQSCVPYLLGDLPDTGHQVVGEVWEVDDVTLQNLDEYPSFPSHPPILPACLPVEWMPCDTTRYEGIGKGYYSRRVISVTERVGPEGNEGRQFQASVYFKTESESTPELRKAPMLSEYTLDFHRTHYNAIMHIMVKQQLYMGDVNWGDINS